MGKLCTWNKMRAHCYVAVAIDHLTRLFGVTRDAEEECFYFFYVFVLTAACIMYQVHVFSANCPMMLNCA